MNFIIKFIHATHLYRATFWALLIPVAFLLGLESAVALVFVMSAYANIMTDFGAWEAKQAKEESE
jgi:hypothetical protein